MENETLKALEKEIAKIRYQLMLKGTELDFNKQNVQASNVEKIEKLSKEVSELRGKLLNLNEEIRKLKHTYYISYEVRFKNIWTNQIDKEIYNETVLLNKDLQINLPTANNWKLDNKNVSELIFDLLESLKHKYDEVTLLRIKRI